MNKVHVLDCTLRDGGYCNQWRFGYKNIQRIIESLVRAKIDIVECGFLTNCIEYQKDVSKFTTLYEIGTVLPQDRENKIFVAMINFGEYDVDMLPAYDGTSIDGIRVTFHKNDREDALRMCKAIKEKGYKVFVQPMVSLNYSDEEFLDIIHKVNEIMPYAFYIVDSFGMMKKKNLLRLFYMIEHNLNEKIWIGFHSHNNMQLAYSNAQSLVDIQTNRNLIIDASVYGMGRGAGNLNTELFVDYLNENAGKAYALSPLLNVIDEILNDFYQRNYWGYSLPNYLSASHFAHPNYAEYFADKNTLTVGVMDELFDMMEQDKAVEYDKDYAEQIYNEYMKSKSARACVYGSLRDVFESKDVLLIAPGKSSEDEKNRIAEFSKRENVVTMSVNFDYDDKVVDYIFISNLRRFREIENISIDKCIFTSNLSVEEAKYIVDYCELTSDVEAVYDNAGLMAIRLLMNLGVEKIYLAGFDGYSYDSDNNYMSKQKVYMTKRRVIDSMNEGMIQVLRLYSNEFPIEFLTMPKYIVI
ncbi:MAG: aldolase catalytic domain-containing protein [Bacteroidales bacterium]|nr:aldolase catalytic domain-containing protein [Clostridium sp.]MCM1203285.1 aldolase catalytic domain-containing protein [Bacteroidales bacterium]